MTGTTIWTIGHSTRSLEEFLELLSANRIEAVADVRRYPGSRRWPHFTREPLGTALEKRAILYLWLPELGGRRAPRPDTEHGVAERSLQGICRLHGNRGVCRGPDPTGKPGVRAANGSAVCRIALVALSPWLDC